MAIQSHTIATGMIAHHGRIAAFAELDMLLKFFILLFTKYAEKIFSADFFLIFISIANIQRVF